MVDPVHEAPILMHSKILQRKAGFGATVRTFPFFIRQIEHGMRRMLERVVAARHAAFLDRSDFTAYRDHGVTKSIKLGLRFGFCRFDHQRAGDWKAHRRSMKAVVDKPLRDVVNQDAGSLLQGTRIENALVCNSAVPTLEEER